MADQGNRTFICSVVFVDLVAYTKKSVSEQIEIKDHFTQLLSEALVNIPQDQRLILDTGDGAAMSFLGDPEDALFVAMHIRDSMRKLAEQAVAVPDTANLDATAPYPISSMFGSLLRIGINLGPVKLVRDINDQPNIIGDGINVAQRIMSFAQPKNTLSSSNTKARAPTSTCASMKIMLLVIQMQRLTTPKQAWKAVRRPLDLMAAAGIQWAPRPVAMARTQRRSQSSLLKMRRYLFCKTGKSSC